MPYIFRRLLVISIIFISVPFSYANEELGSKTKKPIEVNWLLAHEPVSVFLDAAREFSKEVGIKSNSALKVNILTRSDLEREKWRIYSAINSLRKGQIQMTQIYTTSLGSYHNKLWVLDIPFLFRDHEHAQKVLDGKIGQKLLEGLSESNMKGLAFTYSGGYRILPTTNKEIHRMEDFKGMRIGTSSSPVAREFFEDLGALSVPLPLEKRREMTEKKLIEGLETTFTRYLSMNQNKATPIVNDTGHSLFLTSIVINKTFFDSLSKKHQKIILSAAERASILERKNSVLEGIRAKKASLSQGLRVVDLSLSEKKRIKTAIKPLYKRFNDIFGANLINDIESVQ
ncbi:MAG: TRAP transporter substrate-binding protein [Bdellovibrionales bacterium]|nr:TRAP transporter substrate-binding protein [Bdellovibrionales bacterium]